MDIKNENYYHGIWFTPIDDMSDVMATLYEEDGQWIIRYRFRYYADEDSDPHFGGDKKSCYTVKIPSLKEGERVAEGMFKALEEAPLFELDFLPLGVKGDKVMDIILKDPPKWMHINKMSEIPNEE